MPRGKEKIFDLEGNRTYNDLIGPLVYQLSYKARRERGVDDYGGNCGNHPRGGGGGGGGTPRNFR